jgi:hypothetical protein
MEPLPRSGPGAAPSKALAKSSYIILYKERGLVTDAQRTELDDAAFEYRVRAKGMQARRDIILKIWRSSQVKGLRVMAKLVGDTPQHLAFVAGLAATNKAQKSGNCIRQQRRKPSISESIDLLNNDQRQHGKRDQSSFRHGGLENIKISGHGQRRSTVN